MDAVAVLTECKELSLQGRITFPEVVRRLSEAGVERYHVDLTRDEATYYLTGGESHVLALHAIDPTGTGGVVLCGRPGPAHAAWLDGLAALRPAGARVLRLPPDVTMGRLVGGLDLAATQGQRHAA